MNVGDESRVAYLETAVSSLEARLKDLANRDASSAAGVMQAAVDRTSSHPTSSVQPSEGDLFKRLCQLERQFEAFGEMGSGTGSGDDPDVRIQIVGVLGKQTVMHRDLLEIGVRLQLIEQG